MPARYFEFKDKTSSKFWAITVSGKKVTVRFGKIGTDGQSTLKEFTSPAEAKTHVEKLIAEKVKKRYREMGAPAPAVTLVAKPVSKTAVPQTLTISGDGIDVEFVALPAKRATRILEDGISEDALDELFSASATESGVCEAKVTVAGKVVGKFALENFTRAEATKLGDRKSGGQWFLVKEQFERGAFRTIEIKGSFDPRNLQCAASFYDLNGLQFGTLEFSYGGEEGEFDSTTTRSSEVFLLSPEGERLGFELVENEDEEQGDSAESRLELRCPSLESLRKLRAWLVDGWPVSLSEQVTERELLLVVAGQKSALTSVEQIVRRGRQDYGTVKIKWA